MGSQYKYIIVGAGSSGCVLANQLSENVKNQVLLIEAGPARDDFVVKMPKGFGKLLFDDKIVRRFSTIPEKATNNESEHWPRGAMVGGSSRINGMFYTRGQPEDYNDWEAGGASGWGWDKMSDCFRRLEDHELGADGVRGVGGPLYVACHKNHNPLADAFVNAAHEMGLEVRDDLNRPEQEGVGYVNLNIKDGVRVDAASAFLDPVKARSNLKMRTDCFVQKILFEGKRAIGVRCLQDGNTVDFFAEEIILSAGSIQSPQLLQLSGVGNRSHLEGLGIDVVADIPGVGENLCEHRFIGLQFRINKPSLNREFSGLRLVKNLFQYLFRKQGVMSTGPHDVVAFVKTDPALTRPDVELMMAPFSTAPGKVNAEFEKEDGIQVLGYQLRPESRGSIKIVSTNPLVDPEIRPNYLSTEEDRNISDRIVRYIREVCAKTPLASIIISETTPGESVANVEDAIRFNEETGCPVLHPAGTCKMGVDAMAVVDPSCQVVGVDGLRVVDCSIMPSLISGHTSGPAMAMAIRASDIILGRNATG